VTNGDWIRFNEYDDVLASTDLLVLVAGSLKNAPTNWKWMILAAHSFLQGALVCAVQDSTRTNILKKKSAKETLDWLNSDLTENQPLQYLDEFPELLKKYRTKYRSITIEISQEKDLATLHKEFRNNFTHFAPMQWSIEAAGLPRIVGTAVNLAEAAMRQHQVEIHLSEQMKQRLTQNLVTIRGALLGY
jgi:hypothetical protein